MTGPERFGRRKFLAGSLGGAASEAFRLFSASPRDSVQDRSARPGRSVITRPLGRTGVELPVVSMGCVNTLEPALVERAFDLGVRHFDTAGGYARGLNEEMLGKAVKAIGRRNEVIIGTKSAVNLVGRSVENVKKDFIRNAEASLRRLQTDYIDILDYHGAFASAELKHPGVLEALQTLKERKKIRLAGFSTHMNMAACIRAAVPLNFYDVILTSFNYAYWDDSDLLAALESAAAAGIGLIVMKTQCTQYVDRSFVRSKDQLKYHQGKIMQTAVLKWVLRHPFVTTAIPGFATFEQMDEDFGVAYDLEYNEAEKKFLADRGVGFSLAYCLQCGRCRPDCPHGVDVPVLMRTHMYAAKNSNLILARETLDGIAPESGPGGCSSCSACALRCPNGVDIAGRIEDLKMLYV